MCDCIAKLDELLKPHNTRIHMPFWSLSGVLRPFVETMKADEKKRGKPKSVCATYCPFCGEKYAESGSDDE